METVIARHKRGLLIPLLCLPVCVPLSVCLWDYGAFISRDVHGGGRYHGQLHRPGSAGDCALPCHPREASPLTMCSPLSTTQPPRPHHQPSPLQRSRTPSFPSVCLGSSVGLLGGLMGSSKWCGGGRGGAAVVVVVAVGVVMTQGLMLTMKLLNKKPFI